MELTTTSPTALEPQVKAAARNSPAVEDYVIDAVKTAMLKPSLDELLAPVCGQRNDC